MPHWKIKISQSKSNQQFWWQTEKYLHNSIIYSPNDSELFEWVLFHSILFSLFDFSRANQPKALSMMVICAYVLFSNNINHSPSTPLCWVFTILGNTYKSSSECKVIYFFPVYCKLDYQFIWMCLPLNPWIILNKIFL